MNKYCIRRDKITNELLFCIRFENQRLLFPWDPNPENATYVLLGITILFITRSTDINIFNDAVIAKENELYEFEDDESALLYCEVAENE